MFIGKLFLCDVRSEGVVPGDGCRRKNEISLSPSTATKPRRKTARKKKCLDNNHQNYN